MRKIGFIGVFVFLLGSGLMAQNSTSGQENEGNPYPWTPINIEVITMSDGSTKELHTVSEEEYYRFWKAHPQMYVSDLQDCRTQAGDCLETVVITPPVKPKPKS